MKIDSLSVVRLANGQRVAARIGPLLLWFRIPGAFELDELDASPFVIAALVPAMLLGEDIVVDRSLFVSERLLRSIDVIQGMYCSWNPVFKRVAVSARTQSGKKRGTLRASFFSGGVDGTYTLLSRQAEVDSLLLINGFDFTMDAPTWEAMVNRNASFAASVGKSLVPIETNFKTFTANFSVARYANFGSVLASIGVLLGFERVYLSASETYASLRPIGSHPLLDPLWSTEATELEHVGLEADRVAKLERVAQHEGAMANLWVCWKDPRENCGRCEKCLRTAVALEILGLPRTIFRDDPVQQGYGSIRPRGEEDREYYRIFRDEATRRGHRALARALERKLFAYDARRFANEVLDVFAPSAAERLRRWRRPTGDELVDISVFPRYSDGLVLQKIRDRLHRGELLDEQPVGSVYQ